VSRTFVTALIYFGAIFLCQLLTVRIARAQEETKIAPPSGGVELQEIRIAPWAVLGAAKYADLTNMKLGLSSATSLIVGIVPR